MSLTNHWASQGNFVNCLSFLETEKSKFKGITKRNGIHIVLIAKTLILRVQIREIQLTYWWCTARSARSLTKMAPLRCLTYGSIAVGHLANQKRVRQARDQRSVTQRMRTKLAGNFCCVVFFFTWRLANPNKNKILPQAVFWCFFQGWSRPKAEP